MSDRTSTLHTTQCSIIVQSFITAAVAVDKLWNDSSTSQKVIQALHAVIFSVPQNVDTVSHPVNAWKNIKLDIIL